MNKHSGIGSETPVSYEAYDDMQRNIRELMNGSSAGAHSVVGGARSSRHDPAVTRLANGSQEIKFGDQVAADAVYGWPANGGNANPSAPSTAAAANDVAAAQRRDAIVTQLPDGNQEINFGEPATADTDARVRGNRRATIRPDALNALEQNFRANAGDARTVSRAPRETEAQNLRELLGSASLEPAIRDEGRRMPPSVRVWRAPNRNATAAPASAEEIAAANAVYGWSDNEPASAAASVAPAAVTGDAANTVDVSALRQAEFDYLGNLYGQTSNFLRNFHAENPNATVTDENDPAQWPAVFAQGLTANQKGFADRQAVAASNDPDYTSDQAANSLASVKAFIEHARRYNNAAKASIEALPSSADKAKHLADIASITTLLDGMSDIAENANLPLAPATPASAAASATVTQNPQNIDPDQPVRQLLPRVAITPEIFDAVVVKEAQPEVAYLKQLTEVTQRMVNELVQPGPQGTPSARNLQFAKSLSEDFLLPVQLRMTDIVAGGSRYNPAEGKIFFDGRQQWLQDRIKEFGAQQAELRKETGWAVNRDNRAARAELDNLKRTAGIIKGIRPATNTTGSKIGNFFKAAAKGLLAVTSKVAPAIAGAAVGWGLRAVFAAAALTVTASILPAAAAVLVASVATGAIAGAASRGVSDGLRHLITRHEAIRAGREIPKFKLGASLAKGAKWGAIGGGVASAIGLAADYVNHTPPLFDHAATTPAAAAISPPAAAAAAAAAATTPADPLAPLLAEVQQKVDNHFFDGLVENGMDVKSEIVQSLAAHHADPTNMVSVNRIEWRLGGAAELWHNQAVLHHVANADSFSAQVAGLGHRIADAVGVNDKVAGILRGDTEFFTRIGRGAELVAPTP